MDYRENCNNYLVTLSSCVVFYYFVFFCTVLFCSEITISVICNRIPRDNKIQTNCTFVPVLMQFTKMCDVK